MAALILLILYLVLVVTLPVASSNFKSTSTYHFAEHDLTVLHQSSVARIQVNQGPWFTVPHNHHVLVCLHQPTLLSSQSPDTARAVWHAQAIAAIHAVSSQAPHAHGPGNHDQHAWFTFVASSSSSSSPQVVYASPDNALLVLVVPNDSSSLGIADHLPSALPPTTRVHRIDPRVPLHPVPPSHSHQTIVSNLETKPDPQLVALLANVSIAELQRTVRYLTGEDPKSPLTTRHSLSRGHRMAAQWVQARMLQSGCHSVHLVDFKEGYGPNVVCTINGTDPDPEMRNQQVILGAHLDDRGSLFVPFARAPGADDDASGTSMLLAFLRALHTSGLRLRRTLKVINFAGEEQGLVGSRAYARQARARNDPIVFMLQGDMLAYRRPGEPLQCALPAAHASPQANLVVRKVAEAYVPEVQVGLTQACCSDHQSFFEQGFVSTQVFERNGPIADPMYHNRGDLSDRLGYDWEQLRAVARVAIATIVTVAEIAD